MTQGNQECRLCSGDTFPVFQKQVLSRYPVIYLRCSRCQSLQTENPWWLPEAYSSAAPPIDLRAIARAMAIRSLIYRVLDLLATPRAVTLLDWGAGNGILVRLLRDSGTDAYTCDRYVRALYTEEREPPPRCDVITAFEVWEHFAEPCAETDRIFNYRPALVIASTGLYSGQSADWAYLHPDIGRHVFFYSAEALDFLARRHGYEVVCGSRFAVFVLEAVEASARPALRACLETPDRL